MLGEEGRLVVPEDGKVVAGAYVVDRAVIKA